MKLEIIVAMVVALYVVGCASGEATRTSATHYAPTAPSSVEVLFEKPTRTYEVIGFVSGKGANMSSQSDVFEAMRNEAAKIGADAIIMRSDIEEQTAYTGNPTLPVAAWKQGTAIAIRWLK